MRQLSAIELQKAVRKLGIIFQDDCPIDVLSHHPTQNTHMGQRATDLASSKRTPDLRINEIPSDDGAD
jgi:hypothetical protein